MRRLIESCFIDGPAGRIEALLEEPEAGEPREAALVCHPHPLYGGTMHNKVVHRLARGLRREGFVVLRFNFRGVNRSEGTYDHGEGELEDARAALKWLRTRYPALPFTLAGFSFGSGIVLRLGCSMEGASRVIAVGLPTTYHALVPLDRCPAPRIFIQSTGDEFGGRRELEAFFARIRGEKRLIWVEATDHFFSSALDVFEKAVRAVVE